jgi:hypothetical protein
MMMVVVVEKVVTSNWCQKLHTNEEPGYVGAPAHV